MFDAAKIEKEVTDDTAVLLDVRTEEERTVGGFASGSVHFDIARLHAGDVPDILKHAAVYIYCRSGSRALAAEGMLKEHGFVNAVAIGGLSDWGRV